MTLKLDQHAELLACVRRGDDVPMGAVVGLIRASYPELFKQISSVLTKGQEIVVIEPGDTLLVKPDSCVMHRDKLIRRRVVRRDEESRDHEPRDEKSADVPDITDYFKEFDAPKNGIANVEWDRPYYGQVLPNEQRSGSFVITTHEPLGVASKEVPLKQLSDGARREFVEAFSTRSIPPVINAFFGVRAFLLTPDSLLLARPDLHGTDRLQELTRNPLKLDSEHIISNFPEKHPEAFQFFKNLRDKAFACEERRAELSLDGLAKQVSLEILTAVAVPQYHGTVSNLLRMQYAFIQPNRIVGSSLMSAGAALQPAWDISVQLRLLEGMARANHQYSSI
jgi:hypothetical protein